jgi:hypothetical protein
MLIELGVRRVQPLVLALLLMGACVRPQSAPPTAQVQVPAEAADTSIVVNRVTISARDTSLVAAVALTVADSAGGFEVRLDPRRLPTAFDAADALPSQADMKLDADGGVAKVASLVDVTLRQPDRKRLEATCAGRTPCPARDMAQIVVGTGRPGGPKMPPRAAPITVKPTYWTVRVIATNMGPSGRNTTVSDYVFDKTPSGWVFVRQVALFSIG